MTTDPLTPPSSVPPLTVRPITPDDAPRLGDLLQRCSPETTYNRFFTAIRRPRPATLQWLAEVDHFRREALVAMGDGAGCAVARYDWTGAADDQAEIAILVEDAWQRRRVGTTLLPLLADLAIDRGVRVFTATVLANNTAVAQLLRRVFPSVIVRNEGYAHTVTIPLGTPQGLALAPMPRAGGLPTLAKAVTGPKQRCDYLVHATGAGRSPGPGRAARRRRLQRQEEPGCPPRTRCCSRPAPRREAPRPRVAPGPAVWTGSSGSASAVRPWRGSSAAAWRRSSPWPTSSS